MLIGGREREDNVTDDISEQIKHGRVFSAGQL